MKIDAKDFDQRARTVFKPAYPVVAAQILAHTGINQGSCLDIGCGGGYLGLELLRQSQLSLLFLDQSPQMLEIVHANLMESGLSPRGETILANAERIPLPDNSVDLAISRGSVFFWDDHVAAFSEIHRVLAPGGMTYIGGGFGTPQIKAQIADGLKERGEDHQKWESMVQRNLGPEMRQKFCLALQDARIPHFELLHNQEEGMWIVISKQN